MKAFAFQPGEAIVSYEAVSKPAVALVYPHALVLSSSMSLGTVANVGDIYREEKP